MSKGKKIALIVSMALLLVVAAVLNVTLLVNNKKDDGTVTPTGFFATGRSDRQSTRNYEIAELNSIIAMEGDEYAEARKTPLPKSKALWTQWKRNCCWKRYLKRKVSTTCLSPSTQQATTSA